MQPLAAQLIPAPQSPRPHRRKHDRGIEDVGYRESFIDWYLIYRNHAQMPDLAADVAQDELARVDLDFDAGRTIDYLGLGRPVH